MLKKTDVTALSISLETDHQQRLFIELTEDGSIKRMGSAQAGEEPQDLYIGEVSGSLFSQLIEAMPDDLLTNTGVYNVPNSQGTPIKLSISASTPEKTELLEFNFSMESTGIPEEFRDFVGDARSITEEWFQEQKKMAQSSD